ncbi:MAG: HigA family addiction module antidote protein [Rhizorhabdus sp.]|uniref:HigA family addiction module antitoxin n=1 Tax=Rhizorhabdus sp. TaxID=1968843 RepID=UPI001B5A9EAC|nr:HigA family addiction module antitoxin [Rhizorhabdus sp.]MBP8235739.1 HigA family addiction module antidote protein [Rhizorhabdus sp.]
MTDQPPDDFKITDPAEQLVARQPEGFRHPGSFVRTEVLEPLGLKVAPACAAMGLNRQNFIKMLDGRGPLTRDVAYRLEALTGVDADLLIAMQAAYDRGREMPARAEYRQTITRWSPPSKD